MTYSIDDMHLFFSVGLAYGSYIVVDLSHMG